ncbi:amidohydrolase family protein [Sphingomonas tabacisoli]|uniref:Amidohydrolase family protein n=1 Tax=Sphingomonas tabacisoli TaxID=2249466 RepID=A0ABW4I798_9SPHN
MNLIIRNVRPWGAAATDIIIDDGLVGTGAGKRAEFDGRGRVLLPGLHDHHIHILASAARRSSVDLAGLVDAKAVEAALRSAAAAAPPGAWLRAVGYDEGAAGLPDADLLDDWVSDRPLKLQDRTGALWALNRLGLASLGAATFPPGCERDAAGQPTGRFWREDRWLGRHLPRSNIDVAGLGSELAALGVTGLTDAGAGNGPDEAALLSSSALPQTLVLMGNESLPHAHEYRRGPLKLLIDERDPPDLDVLARRISEARGQRRNVATHCVTATELSLFLAALELSGGALSGDRIEHGGEIATAAIAAIAQTPLTVVTNPAFIHDRGDRYRDSIDPQQWSDLYRARSLIEANIPLAAGSDAPYASFDPWLGMRTARDRLTATRQSLGRGERISARQALCLYLGEPLNPGSARTIAPGAPADFMLCDGSLDEVLADLTPDRVAATFVAGRPVFQRR